MQLKIFVRIDENEYARMCFTLGGQMMQSEDPQEASHDPPILLN